MRSYLKRSALLPQTEVLSPVFHLQKGRGMTEEDALCNSSKKMNLWQGFQFPLAVRYQSCISKRFNKVLAYVIREISIADSFCGFCIFKYCHGA